MTDRQKKIERKRRLARRRKVNAISRAIMCVVKLALLVVASAAFLIVFAHHAEVNPAKTVLILEFVASWMFSAWLFYQVFVKPNEDK